MISKENSVDLVVFKVVKKNSKQIGWEDFLTIRGDPARLFFILALSQSSELLQQWWPDIAADPLIIECYIDPNAIFGLFAYGRVLIS